MTDNRAASCKEDIDLILSLTGRMPLSYAFRDDGSLIVVVNTGQKHLYSKQQVEAARQPALPNIQVKQPATQPMPKKKK